MENEKNIVETNDSVSKSQKKREERKKKNAQIKTEAMISNAIGFIIIAIVAAGIIFAIGSSIAKKSKVITPSDNYSQNIEENGFIKGVNASQSVTIPSDYDSIAIPADEVAYTDEEFEDAKKNALEAHKVLNTETKEKVKDGDTVNIDYVGTVDGVEFEGGNSKGEGSDLTIGSGMFIDDFEQQVIGHTVGDEFDVEVTFPEGYSAIELSGKDAVFAVTLNGIYEEGTFDDDFVAENLAAYASTVDEYRDYLAGNAKESRMKEAVKNYLLENSTVSKYPGSYLKSLKSTKKYSDQESFEYMNEMYKSYYGQGYSSFEEYVGMSEAEYDVSLDETCKEEEKEKLVYQAIVEKQNITISDDEFMNKLIEDRGSEESANEQIEHYGKGYLMQQMLDDKALEFCIEKATVK